MKEHKMKQVAIQMMKKLKDIDLDKVSAITIGIQMSGKGDYHKMPDGSMMKGKEHEEEDYEDADESCEDEED